MTSLENNRMIDMRTLGVFTSLTHSLNELGVPQTTSTRVDRQHVLQCDAFRVEYTTVMKGPEECVTSVAIIPYCPPGLREDAYRLSPEPNAAVLARLTKILTKAQTEGGAGVTLLQEFLATQNDYPEYTWAASIDRGAGAQSEDALGIPMLPSFAEFVARPQWIPHYVMKSTLDDDTHWISAVIKDDSVDLIFRTIEENREEGPLPQTLRMKYSGPALSPNEQPAVVGTRLMAGIREIMKHSLFRGALDTHEQLASGNFEVPFLATELDARDGNRTGPHSASVRAQSRTLSSGAITRLDIDLNLSLAQIQIRAHDGPGAAALVFTVPMAASLTRDMWLADVSDAYRMISSPSESGRLCGFYALRRQGASIEYRGADLPTLLGQEAAKKLLDVASELKILVGFQTGPLVSISEMLSICDGIQEVSFQPARREVLTSMFGGLTLGFAPNGSVLFSAKNDLGGSFDGVLHSSIFKGMGQQGKAAEILIDAFARQQLLKDRRHFENVAQILTDSDKSGYSHVISEGHTSFCSIPLSTDPQAYSAYELGAHILKGYGSVAKNLGRSSVHYAEPGTCHVLMGYPGAPFEMILVLKGSSLTEINFAPALPPYADPIRREAPSLRVSTDLGLLNNPEGTEATALLIMDYVRYSKESLDHRLVKPLTEADVCRRAHAMSTALNQPNVANA